MTTASTVAALRQPGSTQGVLYRTAYTLGAPVSKDKHSAHSQQPIFIGVETDLTHFTTERVILLRCKASTRVKVLGLIDHYLTDGATMSSAQAATLAGKCQWVLANGRVGRSALAALSARQYGSDSPSQVTAAARQLRIGGGRVALPVDESLASSLRFLRQLFDGGLPDRRLPALSRAPAPPIVILSDAMWEPAPGTSTGTGHMAFVVWVPDESTGGGTLSYAHKAAPQGLLAWSHAMRPQQSFIIMLELVALAAPYFSSISPSFAGRDVLHFADNQSANAGVVKGRSTAPDLNAIIGELHLQWEHLDIRPWVEYVRSKANVADMPSRGEGALVAAVLGIEAQVVPFRLSPCMARFE